eukprot:TRINITY_DN58850_c0_g1_i1.p1 TRINITY_DN58850_c0_g1~~TRINITY_DN58850_c0_g1_i1.p1  ORF type:complete len:143 (-),score=38.14 TRINITY_DN58850_c0_g1_i1:291-665(-)
MASADAAAGGTKDSANQVVVRGYYVAVNTHDPEGMLAACAHDVEVTFPDASRNWKSIETAREKFSGMFEKLPGFKADWTFEEAADDADIVTVTAHFTAEGYDAHRKMVYTMKEGKIARIDHIDV